MRIVITALLGLLVVAEIALGATGTKVTPAKSGDYSEKYDQIRKEHWAFQPLKQMLPPKPGEASWVKTDVDKFVLAKLEAQGLEPSKAADKRTLIRRATFDLTGLPPTPEEVETFASDTSPKAFEKVVDRLLASKAYGERWGRHWLDVARYGESTGMTRNAPLYYAWRYRDYVIDAFNADKPYNRFIREQLAGDLLPAQNDAQRDAQVVATGFLAIGPKDLNERNPVQFTLNVVDEQIDTMSRAFLAMTVSCARCHDHKFDPIPTADYYSIAGIFRSTDTLSGVTPRKGPFQFYNPDLLVPLSGFKPDNTKENADRAAKAREEFIREMIASNGGDNGPAMAPDQMSGADRREQLRQQRRRQQKLREMSEGGEPGVREVAIAVREGRLPGDSNIFVRGEPDERGPVVPRGTITLPTAGSLADIPQGKSGRLELANWIASERNPLTGRVMVNRIWQHLFGAGLVTTVDNFGTTGESPTHPELLDYLARQFTNDGWSIKRAIRRVMLSSVYQQAGTFDEAKYAIDPDNKLLWRMTPRRLEAEAIRDAILAAAGTLNRERPKASMIMDAPPVDLARADRFGNRFSGEGVTVRSIYLPMLRGVSAGTLDVFDLADNTQVTGCREVTTVAPQALFMMNDPFVLAQSQALAKRVVGECDTDAARIDRAYTIVLARNPSQAERNRALEYVYEFASESGESDAWASVCQALFAGAEFRYVN